MKLLFSIIITIFFFVILYDAMFAWGRFSQYNTEIGRIIFTDRNGEILTELPRKNGYSKSYTGTLDIPLIDEIIAIEDRRYHDHHGIDIIGKLGAVMENIEARAWVRGGSTITEQYIKLRFFPYEKRTILQKGREALWAILYEIKYDKDDILRKYLDIIYMGNGLYGIQAGSEGYFGKSDLSLLEARERLDIITRVKYPNLSRGYEVYRSRISTRLGYTRENNADQETDIIRAPRSNLYPYLTDRVLKEYRSFCNGRTNELEVFVMSIPRDLCDNSEIRLRLSIDGILQKDARNRLESTLFSLREKNVGNGSILVWSEKDQKVLIYIGNSEKGANNTIDMIEERRSVGSILKPFIYLLALRDGHELEDFIIDEQSSYETSEIGEVFVSENYIPRSYGPVTLSDALGNSLNNAAVKLTEILSLGRVYDMFRGFDLALDREVGYYGYGIALGSIELSLEELVHGYRNLTDLKNKEKYLLYRSLQEPSHRAMTFGATSILNTSIPLAVKTGTSSNFRDNWVIGYNDEYIIGVWVGNTDSTPMNDVSGVTGAGPIYRSIVDRMISSEYIGTIDIPPPVGVIEQPLCLDNACFQKVLRSTSSGYIRKSRPASQLFYKEDFVGNISKEEAKKWKIR